MTTAARRKSTQALSIATALLIAATLLSSYAWRAVFDSEQFADRSVAALQAEPVRRLVAERVTDELVLRSQPDLLTARPLIAAAVREVVGGAAFASLFRRGAQDVHRALFRRDRDTVSLTIVDVGVIVHEALAQLRPALAERLELDRRVEVFDLGADGDIAQLASSVRVGTWLLGLLAIAAGAAAVALSADKRRAVARLGVAIAGAGVLVVVATIVARSVFLQRLHDADERAAGAAVWDAFFGDLRFAGWLTAGMGAVIAAAAVSLIRPIEVEEPLRRAWRTATREPAATWLRVARGTALIAAGALVIAVPTQVLLVAVTLAGVYVVYKGAEAVLRAIGPPEGVGDEGVRERLARAGLPRRLRRLAAPAVAAVLVLAAAGAFAAGGGVDAPALAIDRCNGHAELCDRPLNEVALPATHNSMSVPLPGWFAALQERPIKGQLEDGIRGLLLDTHYADLLPNGRVRTHYRSGDDFRQAIEQDSVSARSIESAERLRERLGFRGRGEQGMYLCHTFCELGATPLAPVLEDIHEFLLTHPADVVVIVNQDYVSPADFTAAVADAGLDRYAFAAPRTSPWPTLRELVERDERLVLLAENEAGAARWYQLAFDRVTQDTPFTFSAPSQLVDRDGLAATCTRNRGPADAPLLLINHWINTDPAPRPGNATIVNAYEPLLRRARACERLRSRGVSLLAVDFYRRGDLFRVVDTLNGL